MDKEKVLVSWSGGKDSAFCLYEIMRSGKYEVLALVTNMTESDQCVKMHGIRKELLDAQSKSLGIPVEYLMVSDKCSNAEYEQKFEALIMKYKQKGVTGIVFGDLFLADIKAYRDRSLKAWGMRGIYPVWLRPTQEFAHDVINAGFRTVLTCVDTQVLDPSFAGREYDLDFLEDLPQEIDLCGENGEFHTFVYDGPNFKQPISIERKNNFMKQDRFYYCDLKLGVSEHENSIPFGK